MEQSKALQSLIESADLVQMLEDIIATGAIDKISPASLSGMRVTLKRIRGSLLSSHDVLASDLIARSKSAISDKSTGLNGRVEVEAKNNSADNEQSRRDLRAAIDKSREQTL